MAIEKTNLNRYTSNHIAWMGNLKELCEKRGDSKLIPFIKETIFEAKKHIPQEAQERCGLVKVNTMQEMMDMQDWDFGKLCLSLANASIYDTSVLKKDGRFIYYSKVDNRGLLYPLLMADFLVNTKVFKECDDAPFIILIDEVEETEEDPFVYLMNNVFSLYYKDVPVQYMK